MSYTSTNDFRSSYTRFNYLIAGISFLIIIIKQKNFTYLNDNIFKISLLMWFYFLLTTIFNQSLENTLNFSYVKEFNFRTIFYFRFILFYLAFAYFLINPNHHLVSFSK